jgi:membrane-associated phospholipid phosphatase
VAPPAAAPLSILAAKADPPAADPELAASWDASPVGTALYLPITVSQCLARALSIVFHPLLTAAYLLVAVTAIDASSVWPAAGWLVLVLGLSIGGPALYLWLRVRSKQAEDFQIMLRRQRLRPLLASLGFGALALAVVLSAGGPRALELALSVGVANGIVLALITLGWKISFHTATLTGAVAVLWWYVGTGAAALLVLVMVVGWARLRLRRHTPAQVVAGALVAGAVSTVVILGLHRVLQGI